MAAQVVLHVRTRGMWLARLATFTRSERVFAWAVSRIRIEYRAGREWRDTGARATYDAGRIAL